MIDSRIQSLWELGPEYGHAPWRAAPSVPERVLQIHLDSKESPQRSLRGALASLAGPGCFASVKWRAVKASQRHETLVTLATELRPSLVFLQVQRPGAFPAAAISELRRISSVEDFVAVCWCGDVGGTNGPFPSPDDSWAYELSEHCDLMLYASMSQVRFHRSRGMHNAAYLQIGYDEDRFFEGPDDAYGSRFDAAFLGTRYHAAAWPTLPGNDAELRTRVARAMRSELGSRFGLFGEAWRGAAMKVPAAETGQVYRDSAFALSISLSNDLERYSSDRLMRALACGTAVLMKEFPDWRSFGLEHGKNVLVWNTVEEALDLLREWREPARDEHRRKLARCGARLAREHHSWGVRMQELAPLIAAARGLAVEPHRPW